VAGEVVREPDIDPIPRRSAINLDAVQRGADLAHAGCRSIAPCARESVSVGVLVEVAVACAR
jgi:hypothetical protein